MPIVSISKIQHRYGLSENGPSNTLQLSTAEIGWEIDSRKLFIGNGSIDEGAPIIGNTEILTEFSDILALSDLYRYKGEAVGSHQTGTSISTPVKRSLQYKLDEFASVKDFGAKGDGSTDDTDAINRALYELFVKHNGLVRSRRSLFFPAGIYKTTRPINIPAHAKIYGDGKDSTIIRSEGSNIAVSLADGFQQTGVSIGTTSGNSNNISVIPEYIMCYDITFENLTENSTVLDITSSQNCLFVNSKFVGPVANPVVNGQDELSCVLMQSTPSSITKNIVFESCSFLNNTFAVTVNDDVENILFNFCEFNYLYKSFKIGEFKTNIGPRGFKVLNSHFDNIYDSAIETYSGVSSVVSAYNYYGNVGNSLTANGTDSATAHVIVFADNGNSSISDTFGRPARNNTQYVRVYNAGNSSYQIDPEDGVYYGLHYAESGKSLVLFNNVSTFTDTGISFDADKEKTSLVYYTASRGEESNPNIRQGFMKITANSFGFTISDDFYDDGTDLGLEFTVQVNAGIATLYYKTTDDTYPVVFKYRIERLI